MRSLVTIDFFDGDIGGLLCFEVDEPVSLGCAGLVLSDFAAQNAPEGRERIVHGLVVDGLVQVFDENVADSGFAERRVSLGPHDADGTAFDQIEVHCVQDAFS